MTVKYFKGINNPQELKAKYKELAKQFHPDVNPAGEKTMMQINAEYDYCVECGAGTWTMPDGKPDRANTAASMKEYREIISRLIALEGLNIELCGAWLWIDGLTFFHKDQLKAFGCYWAPKKQKWYWRPAELKETHKHKPMSMDNIRMKYGSVTIEGTAEQRITATA